MKEIVIFTQNECPPCKIVKMFLDDHNVDYRERNISTDNKARKDLTEKYGAFSTPTVLVGEEVIIGFELEKLKKALKIE